MNKLNQASQFFDLQGLDSLRAKSQKQDKQALKEVAQQFESIFVQMLMKSMRAANAAFETESPMNNQYVKFYQQMQDQQMSTELGTKGALGLADLMVQQLSGDTQNYTPASLLGGAKNLPNTLSKDLFPAHSQKVSRVNPDKTAYFADEKAFIKDLFPLAKNAAEKLGTDPLVILAQSALETGWGSKIIQGVNGEFSFNLFNIKADKRWKGEKVKTLTLEYENNIAMQKQDLFRSYSSFKESFNDFVNFLQKNSRYSQALTSGSNAKNFIQGLKHAGYATDPNYVEKVMSVMHRIKTNITSKIK